VIQGTFTESYAEERMPWAKHVADDLLQDDPPHQIWRGGKAGSMYYADRALLSTSIGDSQFRASGGLNVMEDIHTGLADVQNK